MLPVHCVMEKKWKGNIFLRRTALTLTSESRKRWEARDRMCERRC